MNGLEATVPEAQRVLSLENVSISLGAGGDAVTPVGPIDLSLSAGESLGIVGESGSGKSLTLKAIMGLLPPEAHVAGRIDFRDHDGQILPSQVARGRGVSMVFQEPMTALNPTMRVGTQVAWGVRARTGASRSDAAARAVELLAQVGIPEPAERARKWPHQLSGGLRQRVVIAMALATDPTLLLCDEPTTALDVTVQAQILTLLRSLQESWGLSLVFVSHDLGVVSKVCDRIAVMYAGQVVETGPTDSVLRAPRHPYTAALLAAVPSYVKVGKPLAGIGGSPPDPRDFPTGCRFAPRCSFARDECRTTTMQKVANRGHATACIRADELVELAR